MDNQAELSYIFLETHPSDSARVLERVAPESAAALFEEAPLRVVAPVIRQMLPLASARCLLLLDDSKVLGLLRAVGAQAGVALLRQFDGEHRARLLSQLPTALNITYDLLLGYPEDTIGAWMEPNTLALPKSMLVGEALERVKQMDETTNANPYVVNQHLGLVGIIELTELIRADASYSLAVLVKPCPYRLPAQTLLSNVLEHQGWTDYSILPVVDHKDRLVGSLTYATLLKALKIDHETPVNRSSDSMLAATATSYWHGVSALVQSFVNVLPSSSSKERQT